MEKAMRLKIDHFAFEVSDLERAMAFYRDRLGFSAEAAFKDLDEHEDLVVLEMGGGKLELIQALSDENLPIEFVRPQNSRHFCPHLALQTDDFAGVLETIRQQDLHVIHGPLENGFASWVYIADPDGNVIEFFEDILRS
jgi:catechol-2,3-dioxygenase